MNNIVALRIEKSLLQRELRLMLENQVPGLQAPQLEKRGDLDEKQIEDAWVRWATAQRVPDAEMNRLIEMIQSYMQFKMVPQGFANTHQILPQRPKPVQPQADEYQPSGPMTTNRFGKQVRVDAGIGRPHPGLGRRM